MDKCFSLFLILTLQQAVTDVVNVADDVVKMSVSLQLGLQESRSCPLDPPPYLVT